MRCCGEWCDLQKRLCHPASCHSTCQQISYIQRNRRAMRLFSALSESLHLVISSVSMLLPHSKSNCSPFFICFVPLLRSFFPWLGLVRINAERRQKPSESFQHPHLPSQLKDAGTDEIQRSSKEDVFARRKITERYDVHLTALNYCLGFSRCVSLGMERSRRKEDSLQCGNINIETEGRREEGRGTESFAHEY